VTAVQTAPGANPGVPGAHNAVPVDDSWYEEQTLQVANLRAFGAYPVIAVCKDCHGRIRRIGTRAPWAHVLQEVTASECSQGGKCEPVLKQRRRDAPIEYHGYQFRRRSHTNLAAVRGHGGTRRGRL